MGHSRGSCLPGSGAPRRGRRLLAAALSMAAAAAAAPADEIRLTNGKTLEVEDTRREGDVIWASLEGGGEVGISADRVQEIRHVPKPQPRPAPAAAGEPVGRSVPAHLEPVIRGAAARHGVDPRLVKAVIQVESGWDPQAVSPKGAMGLMQLMPATARAHGVTDPFDPVQNVEAGTAELADLLRQHRGELSMALAAYNAGGGAVDRHDGIPPYRETLGYVRKVLNLYFDQPLASAP